MLRQRSHTVTRVRGGAPPGASRIATSRRWRTGPGRRWWRRPSGGVEDRNHRSGSMVWRSWQVAAPLRGRRGSQPHLGNAGQGDLDRWRRPSGGVEDRNLDVAAGGHRGVGEWRRPSGGVEDRNSPSVLVTAGRPDVAAPLRGRRGSQPLSALGGGRTAEGGGAPPGASRIATAGRSPSKSTTERVAAPLRGRRGSQHQPGRTRHRPRPGWRRPSGGVEDRNIATEDLADGYQSGGGAPPGASRIATAASTHSITT